MSASERGDPVIFRLDQGGDGLALARRWMEMRRPGGFPNRLNAWPVEVAEGLIRVRCEVDQGHANFVGLVHGGVTSALVDIAGGGAAMTLLAEGETLLTTDLTVRFLEAAPITSGALEAEGRVTYRGGRKLVTEVAVRREDGAVVAMGTVGVSVRAPRP